MLIVTCQVDAAPREAQGVKELIAMELEKLGGVKVLMVKEGAPRQMTLFDGPKENRR